ncbi:MAG: hypothetical protein Q9168_000470 [Polycauliona sp. 1 TL-2023]
MLKSTYKPAAAPPSLPAGWTEHKAPTGASTKGASEQSTYTRPLDRYPQVDPTSSGNNFRGIDPQASFQQHGGPYGFATGQQSFNSPQSRPLGNIKGSEARLRSQPQDRPRSKHAIPGCEPWLLVTTRLGRRFVYNPGNQESFWKFPPDVMKAVVEYDRLERERKVQDENTRMSVVESRESPQIAGTPTTEREGPLLPNGEQPEEKPIDESDEYEEVEVTDDEEDDETAAKRQKTEGNGPDQLVEFDEDDIAYQLAAMGQDYGLDPGEYGSVEHEELEEGAEGLSLSQEDASALFQDMLDDHRVNPYHPWDKLIQEGRIIEDDRYTILPNMRARKDVWGEWSRVRMQELKELREKEEKKDPLIPYLNFLQGRATPKLYWPEFRRKYLKEAEMRTTKPSDKEREKWYRDFINRMAPPTPLHFNQAGGALITALGTKLPESTLKSDLVSLLKSTPLTILNRSSSMAALPPSLLTDIRYITLRPSVRDPLIETHICTLADAPDTVVDPEEQKEKVRQKQEREQRNALAERQRQVQREKIKAKEALDYSKGVMREGDRELQQAMTVGKESLLSYMEKEKQPPLPPVGDEP